MTDIRKINKIIAQYQYNKLVYLFIYTPKKSEISTKNLDIKNINTEDELRQSIHNLYNATNNIEEVSGYAQLEHSRTVISNTHPTTTCVNDKACTIHNRSNHAMRQFPQFWRDDRGLMERTCPHGIGHPDPDDICLTYDEGNLIHGCDGCCAGAYEHLKSKSKQEQIEDENLKMIAMERFIKNNDNRHNLDDVLKELNVDSD